MDACVAHRPPPVLSNAQPLPSVTSSKEPATLLLNESETTSLSDRELIEWLEAELTKNPKGVVLTLEQRKRLYGATDLLRTRVNGGTTYLVPATHIRERLHRWKKRLVQQVKTTLLSD